MGSIFITSAESVEYLSFLTVERIIVVEVAVSEAGLRHSHTHSDSVLFERDQQ